MKKINTFLYIIAMVTVIEACNKDEEQTLKLIVTVTANNLYVTLNENPATGQVLGAIEGVTNQGNVSYEIISESPVGAFIINPSTGELTVADSSLFDYEINTKLTAIVNVYNMDVSKNVDVEINLNDVDETVYISFTKITINNDYFLDRWAHQSVIFDGKMWVIGGIGPAGGRTNEVWSSVDGVNWTQVSIVGTHFSERLGHQAFVFNNKLWVIGGSAVPAGTGTSTGIVRSNEVWSTSDGINWTEESIIGTHFSERSGHEAVVFNDKIWIVGGSDEVSLLNDVWSSIDGVNWTEEISIAPFTPRNYHQSIVFNNKILVIGGYDGNDQNDVWSSSDGKNWQKETIISTHFSERSGHQVILFEDKLWLINGEVNFFQQYRDIWSSTDGINWEEEAVLGSYFLGRAYFETLVFNGKLWVIGGKQGVTLSFDDIWIMD